MNSSYLQEERLIANILSMTFTFSFMKKTLHICNINSWGLEDNLHNWIRNPAAYRKELISLVFAGLIEVQ